MQFIENGPDIPNALLQAHEDGNVIFFCGAGISYPAGLPGFQGLVDKIYQEVGTKPISIEERAYHNGQYDVTLDLLERRHPGKRTEVRTALAKILKPKLRLKGAFDTHKALLVLASGRNGNTKLVTTNFDYIFHKLIKKSRSKINIYHAPLLPIPKNSRWNGIVHLHGLISDSPQESELNNLVLTSGDFGLAYLTERWAARFVSELFRSYTVCFIGYSINDPVLRYMMDALAADRLLGETMLQAYALGACEPGQESNETEEWEAKGVIPILYKVPANNTNDHSSLHRTLKTWAEIYRDGVQGKERIVIYYAITQPSSSSQQDNFTGRMLWALSDQSSLPAKRFAEYDPVPSIKWLESFNDNCFCTDDLIQFGVSHHREQNKNVKFSLLRRPANHAKASWMALVSSENSTGQLDDVMLQLGRWLIRHLNDPELVLWIAKCGGRLHDQFASLIEEQLNKLARLEREKDVTELDRIRANAPNAIPNPCMRTLWRLFLSGLIKSHRYSYDLFRWKNQLERDGLTVMLRLELRKILAPKIILSKPLKWDEFETEAKEIQKTKQLVNYELTLTADHVTSTLEYLKQSEIWLSTLPDLFGEFQQLLLDALDILRELGYADSLQDGSYHYLPSISPHWQNRGFHDWVTLIELVRDAWIAIYRTNLHQAKIIVQNWLDLPYPTFRRLAFFAATYQDIAPDGKWVSWLLENNGWWLWSVEVQRETLRLLVLQGNKLSDEPRKKLETAILSGPTRDTFKDNINSEKRKSTDRETWLRLAKLDSGACQLADDAKTHLLKLSKKYPKWKIANNEKDEFPFWISGTGDPDFQEQRVIDKAPCKRSDLVKWLIRKKTSHFFYEDNWNQICRDCFPVSACALIDLACRSKWPVSYWRSALHTWSDDKKLTQRSWRYIAPTLKNIPDSELINIVQSVAWWLEVTSKSLKQHEEIFLELCKRILGLQYQDSTGKDQITMQAINHPIGQATQALLHFWLRRDPNDNDGLPNDVRPLFSSLFNKENAHYRFARVIMAAHLITLFRVDQKWTNEFLLPCFNWEVNTEEALAVWEGFLWSPRLYRPLFSTLKTQFLETVKHYSELDDDYGRQFSTFLTYLALDNVDTLFTPIELQTAFMNLPAKGLQESARALANALNSASEQREQYWTNRIKPFWEEIWPKSQSSMDPSLAKPLARLVIAAGNKFPEALKVMQYWLQPIEHPHYIVNLLQQSNLCIQFPENALNYLNKIMSYNFYPPEELNQCLEDINKAWPETQNDFRYLKMTEYIRKYK